MHLASLLFQFDRLKPGSHTWARDTAAGGRVVERAVHRTDDEAPIQVPELAGLPIQLGWHMGAAVHVGDRTPFMAQCEGLRGPPELQDIEDNRLCTLLQVFGSAQVNGLSAA